MLSNGSSFDYNAKKLKYTALAKENPQLFKKKMDKKKKKRGYWCTTYQLWSHIGCMTRNVLQKDCDEMDCLMTTEVTMAKHSNKLKLMMEAELQIIEKPLELQKLSQEPAAPRSED